MNASNPAVSDPKQSVEITDAAFARVGKILSETPDKSALRISVEGGGCSGFSYKYDLVNEEPGEEDLVFDRDNSRIFIDKISLIYMGGSQIDFVDNLMGQSFQISNPNAVASCGCGTSFTI